MGESAGPEVQTTSLTRQPGPEAIGWATAPPGQPVIARSANAFASTSLIIPDGLYSNFPQEGAKTQVIEELVEKRHSRDCDAIRSAYETIRESFYLHRSRFSVYGANHNKHIQ